MANIERVKAVVEYIEKAIANQPAVVSNKLSFNMDEWYREAKTVDGNVCGTTMCFAGWGAHFAGLKMYEDEGEWETREIFVATGDAERRPTIEEWATKFFDFDSLEAEIFYQTHLGNDIEALKSVINYYLEEEVFEGVEDYDIGVW